MKIEIDLNQIWNRAMNLRDARVMGPQFKGLDIEDVRLARIDVRLSTFQTHTPKERCLFCGKKLQITGGFFVLSYALWGHGGTAEQYACLNQDACMLREAVQDEP